MTFCFKANGNPNLNAIPDWLVVEHSFDARETHFYRVWIVPQIAEVAIALDAIQLDGSVAGWIEHLESWGFERVLQVSCNQFFSPRADRDR